MVFDPESKQNNDDALHAERLRLMGGLLTGISHDFNNILTVILGYCDIAMSSDLVYNPNYCISQIREAALRATKITGSLLTLSQRGGKQEIFNPEVLFQEIAPLVVHLSNSGVHVVTELANNLYYIRADSVWLEQSLLNLVLNAVQASKFGSEVVTRAYNAAVDDPKAFVKGYYKPQVQGTLNPGKYLIIEVEDYGKGIEADILPHIFEQFFTTKPKERNSGIGLSNVLKIVEDSAGHIYVRSQLGKGTLFRILLPKVAQEEVKLMIKNKEESLNRKTSGVVKKRNNSNLENGRMDQG